LGEEYGWDYINEAYKDKEYDLNDVQDLAEYIRGSKVLEEDSYSEEAPASLFGGMSSGMPYYVRESAKEMGIKTIPSEYGKVIVSKLKKEARIKKIGITNKAKEEANKAKKEGYHALEFTNNYSVDSRPEIALFDESQVEILELIEEIKPWQDTTVKTIELVFGAITQGNIDMFSVLEYSFHPGVIKANKLEAVKNLKMILGAMSKFGLIEGDIQNLRTLVKPNKIKEKINNSNSPLAEMLKGKKKEVKKEEATVKAKNNLLR